MCLLPSEKRAMTAEMIYILNSHAGYIEIEIPKFDCRPSSVLIFFASGIAPVSPPLDFTQTGDGLKI